MKLFIGVIVCQKDMDNGNAVAVWDTSLSEWDDWAYFKTPDEYEKLPYKVQNACKFAMNRGTDWFFKADVDTYVRPEKLKPSVDYEGFVLTGETYCSGGAGYLLSRRALEIVAQGEVDDTLEDRWVGRLLSAHGIYPTHSRSFMPWRVPITKSNNVFSVHLSKATGVYDKEEMYSIHREWEAST